MWPLTSRMFFAAKRLAENIGINEADVLGVLSVGPGQLYRRWEEPKKGGGTRPIMAPTEPLMTIQKRLLPILYRVKASEIAHGFVSSRSMLTNAKPHLQSRAMFCLDIKDAFGSAWFSRWYSYKSAPGVPGPQHQFKVDLPELEVITELVEIREGRRRYLAQGAPTSPHIFNLYCSHRLDAGLERLARNVGGVVTRYADNIAFSLPGEAIDPKLRRAIWRTVEDKTGFTVNPRKTQYFHHANVGARPLRLPGVNIIDGKMRLRPSTIQHYRIALFLAGKDGDIDKYNGIKGHVLGVLGKWPPQLGDVYERGQGW